MTHKPTCPTPSSEPIELDVNGILATATAVIAAAGETLAAVAKVLIDYGYQRGYAAGSAAVPAKNCRCSRSHMDDNVRVPVLPLRSTLAP